MGEFLSGSRHIIAQDRSIDPSSHLSAGHEVNVIREINPESRLYDSWTFMRHPPRFQCTWSTLSYASFKLRSHSTNVALLSHQALLFLWNSSEVSLLRIRGLCGSIRYQRLQTSNCLSHYDSVWVCLARYISHPLWYVHEGKLHSSLPPFVMVVTSADRVSVPSERR